MTRALFAALAFVLLGSIPPALARNVLPAKSVLVGRLTHRAASLRLRERSGPGTAMAHRDFWISLPPGARQGRFRWYLLRLRTVVIARPNGAPAQISALVNGRAVLQWDVGPSPGEGPSGRPVIDQLDLLNGETLEPLQVPYTTADESNYVQLRSVHGGANRVRVEVAGFGAGPLVEAIRIHTESGLYATPLRPAKLALHASGPVDASPAHDRRLRVTVSDSGDDARDVVVDLASVPAWVRLGSARERRIGTVRPGHPRHLSFVIRPLRSGLARLAITAESAAGESDITIRLKVGAHRHARTALMALAGLLFLPAVGLFAWSLRAPPRSQRRTAG